MANPVIISYNSVNPKERAFMTKLGNYLSAKNIYALADDPNVSESKMKQQLLNDIFFADDSVFGLSDSRVRNMLPPEKKKPLDEKSATLTKLRSAAAFLKDGSGEAGLDGLLDQIELRVEVEIAKISMR